MYFCKDCFFWCGPFFLKVCTQFVTILLLFLCFVFLTRDWTCITCAGRQSPNHWASGEGPLYCWCITNCAHLWCQIWTFCDMCTSGKPITAVKTGSIFILFESALWLLTAPPSCLLLSSVFIVRDCSESIDQIDKNWHFDSIEPSYPWTWNLSIYLVLWFLLSEYCSFPHTDLVPILLDLSLGFIFWVPVQMQLCF